MSTKEKKGITATELLQIVAEQTIEIWQLRKKIVELIKNQMIAGKTEGKNG